MRQDLADMLRAGDFAPALTEFNQKVVALGDGTSRIECKPEARFENGMGRIHGGFIAALIDTALGTAVHSKVPEGLLFGTVDLNVKYVRGVKASTGMLIASGQVIHAGRTLLTVEAKVADAAGTLYAHGSGSFMVYPKQ